MAGHELSTILLIPFRCPHCGVENDDTAGWVIEHDKVPCQNCRREIELSSSEWLAFRAGLVSAMASLQPLYDKVPN